MHSLSLCRKADVKRYDEGQRMIRELTSNEDTIPPEEQLEALVRYCRNDMVTNPTYDTLWERLQDFKNLRHVEKSLLVIEHLILYGTKKFIRLCLAKKPLLLKLSKYVYKVDGSDIGQNVRRRAKYGDSHYIQSHCLFVSPYYIQSQSI